MCLYPFKELAEEHDALIQEKNQAEEDLIKLENKLQEILRKYEAEARRQHGDFEKQYGTLTPEASQVKILLSDQLNFICNKLVILIVQYNY